MDRSSDVWFGGLGVKCCSSNHNCLQFRSADSLAVSDFPRRSHKSFMCFCSRLDSTGSSATVSSCTMLFGISFLESAELHQLAIHEPLHALYWSMRVLTEAVKWAQHQLSLANLDQVCRSRLDWGKTSTLQNSTDKRRSDQVKQALQVCVPPDLYCAENASSTKQPSLSSPICLQLLSVLPQQRKAVATEHWAADKLHSTRGPDDWSKSDSFL